MYPKYNDTIDQLRPEITATNAEFSNDNNRELDREERDNT